MFWPTVTRNYVAHKSRNDLIQTCQDALPSVVSMPEVLQLRVLADHNASIFLNFLLNSEGSRTSSLQKWKDRLVFRVFGVSFVSLRRSVDILRYTP